MKKKQAKKVLAEGEVTGHMHRVMAVDAEVFGDGPRRRLRAPSGTKLTHEEHGTVTLPPGEYQSDIQREFDPDEQERRVAD